MSKESGSGEQALGLNEDQNVFVLIENKDTEEEEETDNEKSIAKEKISEPTPTFQRSRLRKRVPKAATSIPRSNPIANDSSKRKRRRFGKVSMPSKKGQETDDDASSSKSQSGSEDDHDSVEEESGSENEETFEDIEYDDSWKTKKEITEEDRG